MLKLFLLWIVHKSWKSCDPISRPPPKKTVQSISQNVSVPNTSSNSYQPMLEGDQNVLIQLKLLSHCAVWQASLSQVVHQHLDGKTSCWCGEERYTGSSHDGNVFEDSIFYLLLNDYIFTYVYLACMHASIHSSIQLCLCYLVCFCKCMRGFLFESIRFY